MKVTFHETKQRSVVKAISYRAIIIFADWVFVYFLTRRSDVAILVAVLSNIYSTGLYLGHERLWNRVRWGKTKG